jgi:hypothetical protein
MINFAMCVVATGIVALSLECAGVAFVLLGIAGLLIRYAS